MTRAEVVAPPLVDAALVLAEVMVRLRHAGAVLPVDQESLALAHQHVVGMLAALGVPAGMGNLPEPDYHMLRCVAAQRS